MSVNSSVGFLIGLHDDVGELSVRNRGETGTSVKWKWNDDFPPSLGAYHKYSQHNKDP
jgi:hypothetical protein